MVLPVWLVLPLAITMTLATNQSSQISLPLKSGQIGERMMIVDSDGNRVKLACVNWYGAHMEDLVVNGLDAQPMESIANMMADMGFNCVRLPFALDTFYLDSTVPDNRLSANPDLVGMTAMQIFDKTVEAPTNAGLMVILNNHISTAMWCCSENDGEGLWFTHAYPTEMFEEAVVTMAGRYSDNSLVVGMDLRNELRRAHGHSPNWGNGDQYDWAQEAERVGNLVLEANPNLLILVEGLNYAGDLSGAENTPVRLTDQSKLVYSGHVYPFWGWVGNGNPEDFRASMRESQTFVTEVGGKTELPAPYWLGEFGTNSDDENWQRIYQWLKDEDFDFAYWSIDGYKYPGDGESYGILEEDYKTIRHDWKLEQLQSLMKA